jgi:hypothetical protein
MGLSDVGTAAGDRLSTKIAPGEPWVNDYVGQLAQKNDAPTPRTAPDHPAIPGYVPSNQLASVDSLKTNDPVDPLQPPGLLGAPGSISAWRSAGQRKEELVAGEAPGSHTYQGTVWNGDQFDPQSTTFHASESRDPKTGALISSHVGYDKPVDLTFRINSNGNADTLVQIRGVDSVTTVFNESTGMYQTTVSDHKGHSYQFAANSQGVQTGFSEGPEATRN